jgi:vacuole morphology and inheritance protein 14
VAHLNCIPLFLTQFTAITWIKEFVQLSGRTMLPFASGILTAVLPCLAYESDSKRSILVRNIT